MVKTFRRPNCPSRFLNFFSNSFSSFLATVGGSASDPTQGNDTTYQNRVTQLAFPDGKSVSLLSIFAGSTYAFSPSFKLTSAKVVSLSYPLANNVSKTVLTEWCAPVVAVSKLNF